ncbi:MAG: metallophosphoesterase [Deltaproteobacteria bacterium]|nr:MAG: metallophosphoesterase [Deltaproteobacteria bacterium]
MARLLPFLAFVAVALLLLTGMHYYVWARLVRDPHLSAATARLLTSLLATMALVLPATLVLSRTRGAPRPMVWIAFLWMGVVFLLSAFLGLADAGRALAWVARKLASPDTPADPERRVLLARALAVGVGGVVAGLSAVGVGSALAGLRIKDVLVRIRDLPPALAGLRVVQISDLHIGPLLRKEWVEGVVTRVRALKPDLVAITGDLVDGTVDELREHVAPLARLAEAPRGVYFSTGNHEYYSGVDDWLRYLPTLGIRPLANERVEAAPGLDVAGIHDPTGRGRYAPDLPAALDGRDANRPVVLLAHQPRQFREAARHGVSLTLSGHTHGGQIWPFSWLVALVQPYIAGLHRLGEAQLYVSRGTGFWGPPMRVFAPAEITLLRLFPAQTPVG